VSVIRVLVIDANADWRAYAAILLNNVGVTEIDTASTAVDGVRKAAALEAAPHRSRYRAAGDQRIGRCGQIRSLSPQSRLLLVSAHEDQYCIDAAAAIVRCAFATKRRAAEELPRAVTLAILDLLSPPN
jgi:DNA-binding NarL/FixJ family response regulator